MKCLLFFRHTAQRNRIVCTNDTHIQHNQGFYKGMDLIPDAIEKDSSPKKCPCGVNKCYINSIYHWPFYHLSTYPMFI